MAALYPFNYRLAFAPVLHVKILGVLSNPGLSRVVKHLDSLISNDFAAILMGFLLRAKLGKMMPDGTNYLSCWVMLVQNEKMKSKKVIFQNLD